MKKEWKICKKTEVGISHARNKKGCDDQLCIRETEEMLIAVLADGAGSRSHAAEGAKLVVDHLADWLEVEFDHMVDLEEKKAEREILSHLVSILEKKSQEEAIEMKEFASTLIFAAVKGSRYLFGNLGDGVIGYQKASDHWVICGPEHGRLPGETVFVTSTWKLDRLHLRIGSGVITRVVMMTDGVAEIWYDEKEKAMKPEVEQAFYQVEMGKERTEENQAERFLHEIQKEVWDDIGFILISGRK